MQSPNGYFGEGTITRARRANRSTAIRLRLLKEILLDKSEVDRADNAIAIDVRVRRNDRAIRITKTYAEITVPNSKVQNVHEGITI